MPKSLCYHELSIMSIVVILCRRGLCTVLLTTGLIVETSYLHICPRYVHMKYQVNMTYIFKMAAIFSFGTLSSPACMVSHKALILKTDMHWY